MQGVLYVLSIANYDCQADQSSRSWLNARIIHLRLHFTFVIQNQSEVKRLFGGCRHNLGLNSKMSWEGIAAMTQLGNGSVETCTCTSFPIKGVGPDALFLATSYHVDFPTTGR